MVQCKSIYYRNVVTVYRYVIRAEAIMLINLSISHNFAYYAHKFHLLLAIMILKITIKCYLLSDCSI